MHRPSSAVSICAWRKWGNKMKQWANTGYYKKRQPARNMRPKVYMELVDGEYIKATCRIIVYNAFIIRGVNLVLNRNTNQVKVHMPRLPENLQGDHTNYVYPVNTQARTVLYRAIMKEYNRLQKNQELKKEAETLMRFKEKAVEEQNGTGDDRAAQWTGTDSSQNSGEHGAD